jgi:hypothetical protein
VAVRKALALSGLDPVKRHPDRLSLKIAVGEAGFLDLVKAELGCLVLDFAEILNRVVHGEL